MESAWVRYGVACLAALIVGIAIGSSLNKAVSDQEIARLEQQVFELESQVQAWEDWYNDWQAWRTEEVTLDEEDRIKLIDEDWWERQKDLDMLKEMSRIGSELDAIKRAIEWSNFQDKLDQIYGR